MSPCPMQSLGDPIESDRCLKNQAARLNHLTLIERSPLARGQRFFPPLD